MDFSEPAGVFIVSSPCEKRDRLDALVKLVNRKNESSYNVTMNNCEHFVRNILYKARPNSQAASMICCANIAGGLLNDLKGYVIRLFVMTIVVATFVAILMRHANFQVLLSAIIYFLQMQGHIMNDTCKTNVHGTIVLEEVRKEIKRNVEYFEINESTMKTINNMLSNSLVCKKAENFGYYSAGGIFVFAVLFLLFLDSGFTNLQCKL